MVVGRASGTDLASSLSQNTFLNLGVRPTGGPCGTGGQRRAPGRGATKGPPRRGTREVHLNHFSMWGDLFRGFQEVKDI